MWGSTVLPASYRVSSARIPEESVRVIPLTLLLLILLVLVDEDLAVIAEDDLVPLQRAGRRAFEVDPRWIETAPVAGAFELVLGREPVRSAAEVRARRGEGVDPLLGAD